MAAQNSHEIGAAALTIPLTPAAYEHGPVHPEHPARGLDHACDVFEYLEDEGQRVSKDDQRAVVREARKVLALFAPAASAGSQEPAPADDLQDRYDAAVDALTAIRDHGKTPEFPCHAMFKGDCEDTMRETARAMLAWLSSGDGTEGS